MTDLTFWRRSLPPVEREEWPSSICAFAWFFLLLTSYYLVRPVRETLGSELGTGELPWLFAATFLTMLLLNPIYAMLVARVSRRVLVHVTYRFFSLCLVAFWLLMNRESSPWVARCFFVWVGVFNMFAVSIFWSFLADSFSSDQAKRLFGVIAAGGTIGGVVGSLAAQQSVEQIGVAQLLLIPIVLLEVATWLMTRFHRLAKRFSTTEALAVQDKPTGGSFWEGIASVFQSRYLLAICGLLLLSSICGTTGYFQQIEIIGGTIEDSEQRLKLFARMNLAVQVVTVVLQSLIVGRLIRWFGLPVVLCVLPLVYATSFLGLGLTTTLAMLVVGRVAQRSAAFGILVPAQETLFTVIPRAEIQVQGLYRHGRRPRWRCACQLGLQRAEIHRIDAIGARDRDGTNHLRLVLGCLVARFGRGTASTDDGGITPIPSLDRQVVCELEIRRFRALNGLGPEGRHSPCLWREPPVTGHRTSSRPGGPAQHRCNVSARWA